MRRELEFAAVVERLTLWREEVTDDLSNPARHAGALTLKLQIDAAIATLELCERYRIRPEASVTVLPDLKTRTPSCAFRVAEDHESDNQADWGELEINGWPLELYPGDIIIENSAIKNSA